MHKEIFIKVKDPRVLGKVKHELEDVFRIALIGVLCSCEDYDEISDLIEDKAEEFLAVMANFDIDFIQFLTARLNSTTNHYVVSSVMLGYIASFVTKNPLVMIYPSILCNFVMS